MTKNTVIALIVIVVVAVAAVGAYFLLSDNDKGDKTDITGTYVLYEVEGKEMGLKAYMTEGEDPVYMAIENKKITIDSFDGKNVKATWGGDKMIGTYSNGEMLFGYFFKDGGNEYLENGHGYVKDNVFYYTSVAVDYEGTHTFACTAVFVKEGKKATPSIVTSPLKAGDVFKQLSKEISVDGVYEDISKANADVITVKSMNKGIIELEVKYKESGKEITVKKLAVLTGDKTMISVNGSDHLFGRHYIDGDLMVSNLSYEVDGKKVAITVALSKGTNVPKYELPDLMGKVYSGTTYATYSSGGKTEQSMSFIFADGKKHFAYATTMIAGVSLTKTVQLIPTDNGILVSFSSEYEFGGKEYINCYHGKISKDLKSMVLHWTTYCDDGSYFSSVNVLKLANSDNKLIGSYVADSYEMAYGESILKGDVENTYGKYFTIASVKGNIAAGTFMGKAYVGEMQNNILSFAYKSSATGFALYCSVTFYDDGCIMRSYGASLDDKCGMASVISMTVSGKDTAPAIPTKKIIIEAGESFITFGAVKRVDGKDVTVTELGQTLVCIASNNGLYSFKFTDNGKEYILCGRWAADSNVIRLAGYDNNDSITFNLNLHDDFICLDRESMSDGVGTVITYRMSDDGKERTIMDIESIKGKTYSGELELGTIVNGELKVTKMKYSMKVVDQNMAILTISGSIKVDAHILVNEDGKFKMNFFCVNEIDGVKYGYEAYGALSDNNNTLVLEGLGNSLSSETAFSSFVATLKA